MATVNQLIKKTGLLRHYDKKIRFYNDKKTSLDKKIIEFCSTSRIAN